MIDHSQNGEQFHIAKYFEAHPAKYRRFLDIGAHDGTTLSNTHELMLSGCWSGDYVEADPQLASLIRRDDIRIRSLCSIYAAAFAKRGSPHTIKFNRSTGGGGFYGTTEQSQIEKFKSITTFTEIEIPTITVDNLVGPYDFISLDVEGTNWELLPELAPRLDECQLICVEHDGHSAKMRRFLEPFGLTHVISYNAENLMVGR